MNAEFVGGVLLTAIGLRTRTPARYPSLLLGSYLIYRGFTDANQSRLQWRADDRQVDVTSQDSFPASDPPAWTTAAL